MDGQTGTDRSHHRIQYRTTGWRERRNPVSCWQVHRARILRDPTRETSAVSVPP